MSNNFIKKLIIINLSVICFLLSQSVLAAEFSNTIGNATITSATTITGNKWVKGGDLTIDSGATLQINADSSLTFEPGHKINISNGYILLNATNAQIKKEIVPCVCSGGTCCSNGCNYDPNGTACGSWSSCTSCSYGSSICSQSGPGIQYRSTCSNGQCTGSQSQSCTCTRNTDGICCGNHYMCLSGSCSYRGTTTKTSSGSTTCSSTCGSKGCYSAISVWYCFKTTNCSGSAVTKDMSSSCSTCYTTGCRSGNPFGVCPSPYNLSTRILRNECECYVCP